MPSPKSMVTERTVAGAVAVAAMVKVTGESATGVPLGVIVTVGSADAVIFTVAVTAARAASPLPEPPADAVTSASRLVVMVVVASPWASLTTTV